MRSLFRGCFFFCSSGGLSASACSLLPSPLPAGGALLCLSDNHWNQIQVLIIIHLPNVSPLVSKPALPLARSAFPRAPRHNALYDVTQSHTRNKRLHLCEHDWFVSAAQCIFTLSPVCMQTFRLQPAQTAGETKYYLYICLQVKHKQYLFYYYYCYKCSLSQWRLDE